MKSELRIERLHKKRIKLIRMNVQLDYFPIQKIVNPYISGLSEDWATNSQQQLIKQGKTLHKEKKNLC